MDNHDAILFDLDGVVIDSDLAVTGSINYALVANGFEGHTVENLRRFIGPPLYVAFAELTGQPADSAVVEACVISHRKDYAVASLRDTLVIPGIEAALEELSSERRLAIASSKSLPTVEKILDHFQLRRFFIAVSAPSLSARNETKTDTIARALSQVGSASTMIGDRHFDITAAHDHSLRAIGVTWGVGTAEELTTAGADLIVHDPADLVTTILGPK